MVEKIIAGSNAHVAQLYASGFFGRASDDCDVIMERIAQYPEQLVELDRQPEIEGVHPTGLDQAITFAKGSEPDRVTRQWGYVLHQVKGTHTRKVEEPYKRTTGRLQDYPVF